MEDVHIYVYGEIGNEVTSRDIQSQLSNSKDAKNIFVHISSPGGGVYEGWTIGNILASTGKNTTALIEGYCASIATYIALSCDNVLMAPTARWLVHKPSAGVEGDADDLREGAARLDAIQADIAKKYATRTKQELTIVNDWMNKETEFNTDQAIEAGFVDGLMQPMKAVAKFDLPKITTMAEQKDASVSKLEAIINKAEALYKNLFKHASNMLVELEGGAKIYIETEDGEFVGKKAYTTDAEGNPTEMAAPDGDHKLIDGRTITVAGGVVTAVAEATAQAPANEQIAALEAKNAALEAELAEMRNQNQEITAQNSEMATDIQNAMSSVQELITEVNNLKQVTVGGSFKATKTYVQPVNKQTKKDEPITGLKNWGKQVAKEYGF